MTGKDLTQWIKDNNAEDLQIIIEQRDSGGTYHTAERIGEHSEPRLVDFKDNKDEIICTIYTIKFGDKEPRLFYCKGESLNEND